MKKYETIFTFTPFFKGFLENSFDNVRFLYTQINVYGSFTPPEFVADAEQFFESPPSQIAFQMHEFISTQPPVVSQMHSCRNGATLSTPVFALRRHNPKLLSFLHCWHDNVNAIFTFKKKQNKKNNENNLPSCQTEKVVSHCNSFIFAHWLHFISSFWKFFPLVTSREA